MKLRPFLKAWVVPLASFAALFFILGFVYRYHLPKLKSWLLVEIEQQSRNHLPVRIWPEKLDIHFFPLRISLQNVRVLPQGELKAQLAPTTAEEASISINMFALLRGQLRIGELTLRKAAVTYIAKDSRPQKLNSLKLTELTSIPLDALHLSEIDLQIQLPNPPVSMRLEDLAFRVENRHGALLVDVITPMLAIKKTKTNPILSLAVDTRLLIETHGIQLTGLKVKKQNSFIVASGTVAGDIEKLDFNEATFDTRARFKLHEIYKITKELFPHVNIPKMKGEINFDVSTRHSKGEPMAFDYELASSGLGIEGYYIGQLNARGSYDNKQISIKNAVVFNRAGQVTISDFKLNTDKSKAFSATVNAKKLELSELLSNLKIKDLPLKMDIAGKLPCSGQLTANFKISCNGKLNVPKFHVLSDKPKLPIVSLENLTADGEVHVDRHKVEYKSDLTLPHGKGSSKGTVSYDKGFKISYDGHIADLKDIKRLAGVELEGSANISGQTSGTSKYAVVDAKVKGKNLFLNKYSLGQSVFQLNYKQGILGFKKIQGHYGQSQYSGLVSLNLVKNNIFVKLEAPFLSAGDVQKILGRHLKLPFKLAGTGSATVKLWGPLIFNQLNFDLDSSFYRATAAGETFDRLVAKAHARKGLVQTEEVFAQKGKGMVELKGNLTPQGQLDAVLIGREIRLEQSESVERLGLDINGQLDMSASLRGKITDPNITINGRVTKTLIGESPASDSQFKLDLTPQVFTGDFRLFGQNVRSQFRLPLKSGDRFHLSAKSKDWEYAQLFSLLGHSIHRSGYKTKLTAELKLDSPTGGFWNSSGYLRVNEFLVQRGNVGMNISKPVTLTVQDGVLNAQEITASGERNYIKFSAKDSSRDDLDMSVSGKVDMSLAALMTPFLDDIRGTLALSVQLNGSINHPQLLGSAYFQDGAIKAKAFPHALERVSADVLFNQSTVLINAVKGSLGGGVFTADGRVQLKNFRDMPVTVNGRFENVSLNVPDGFHTRGSGEMKITGNWFPYKLSGVYKIADGNVAKDFTGLASGAQTIKPSTFLPRLFVEESFSPLHLNLDIDIKNPIPVRMLANNIEVDTPISGQVTVLGAPDRPTLRGRLNTGIGGKVTFRSNTFDIRTGQIDYDNAPPENPTVFVSAESRIFAKSYESGNGEITREQEDAYDVTMVVQGSAKKPVISLKSQPQLPEHEIISLLALGITSTNQDMLNSEGQAQNSYQVIGTALLNEQFGLGRGIKESLGVQVDISSTLSADSDENTSIPKVTLKKQWTPKFGASASRTIEKNPKNNVKVQYRVNRNMSVVGRWENTQNSSASQLEVNKEESDSVFGFDVEYRFEFK